MLCTGGESIWNVIHTRIFVTLPDAVAEEPVDGNLREELRIQVEPPFHEPETVEHHGLDGIAVGEVVLPPHFGDGTGDDSGNPEGVKGTGDEPEMADRDVGSFDELSRGGHSEVFSGKYKDPVV